MDKKELEWCERQVDEVHIPVEAVEEVCMHELHEHVVVCNGVVAYKEGQMNKLCWSGTPINKGLVEEIFKMEAWDTIAQLAVPGDWEISLDLEKGYMQVGLDSRVKMFCAFRVSNRTFRYRVLPFGLALAPRDFSKIVRKICAVLRKLGIRVTFCIDDLLVLASSLEDAIATRHLVLKVLHLRGFLCQRKRAN